MTEVTKKIRIDLANQGGLDFLSTIHAVQGDAYSRLVAFELYNGGAKYTPPEGTTAIVRYRREDGTRGNYDVLPDGSSAYTINGNMLTVALAPQLCIVPGLVQLAVGLISGNAEINTFSVRVVVQPNPGITYQSESHLKLAGTVADSGWEPNMYLGTDADGNVTAFGTDKTMTQPGKAADAKVTGDAVGELKEDIFGYTKEYLKSIKKEGIINGSGYWDFPNYYHFFLENINGEIITVIANNNEASIVAFLKTMNNSQGELADFYDNTERIEIYKASAKSFVIPKDCKYIYFTYGTENGEYLPSDIIIDGVSIFENRNAKEKYTFSAIDELNFYTFGTMPKEERQVITSDGLWSNGDYKHVFLPIPNFRGKNIQIIASEKNSIIAFLKTNRCITGESADFSDNHKERIMIAPKNLFSDIIPDDCNYLYIYSSDSDGYSTLPEDICIDGVSLFSPIKKSDKYETIFFDDFDTFNENVWSVLEQPLNTGSYGSRWVKNKKTVSIDNSCLILRAYKPIIEDEIALLGNKVALSGYVSSHKHFAIKKGRVTCRYKYDKPTGNGVGGCFWLFGQNKKWPNAFEIDIAETYTDKNDISNLLHGPDENGDDKVTYKSADIFGRQYWNIYTCEWDENNVRIHINGFLMANWNVNDLGYIDVLQYPMDIRFNIKTSSNPTDDICSLMIDWVKVESFVKEPLYSIEHEDIILNIGEEYYIKPIFNNGNDCTNYAYNVFADSDCIELHEVENDISHYVLHKIVASKEGTAKVHLLSGNGSIECVFSVTIN